MKVLLELGKAKQSKGYYLAQGVVQEGEQKYEELIEYECLEDYVDDLYHLYAEGELEIDDDCDLILDWDEEIDYEL